MKVSIPEVVSDLEKSFYKYEKALNENDVAVLTELFWDSPQVIRYGVNEQLYGADEIRNFRSNRPAIDLRRDLLKVWIVTYGEDFATASCEYRRRETGRIGRQMQTWLRIDGAWKVVAAHVSLLPA
jgi:Protein of unknown function (DUF3225)